MESGTTSMPSYWLRPTRSEKLTGRSQWIPRSVVPISMGLTLGVLTSPQGAFANHKKLGRAEPEGHALGRSRGGLSTKIHAVVDGRGLPIAIVTTGGQRHDGAMLEDVLDEIRVPRIGPGRPRTRPDAVVADKAYSSGVTRRMLAARGIKTVIPQKSNEKNARKNKGSGGGRPPSLDEEAYRGRNIVERHFGLAKQWRAIATRYDKKATNYRAGAVLCAVITCLRQ